MIHSWFFNRIRIFATKPMWRYDTDNIYPVTSWLRTTQQLINPHRVWQSKSAFLTYPCNSITPNCAVVAFNLLQCVRLLCAKAVGAFIYFEWSTLTQRCCGLWTEWMCVRVTAWCSPSTSPLEYTRYIHVHPFQSKSYPFLVDVLMRTRGGRNTVQAMRVHHSQRYTLEHTVTRIECGEFT